jgi:hypothetical protein
MNHIFDFILLIGVCTLILVSKKNSGDLALIAMRNISLIVIIFWTLAWLDIKLISQNSLLIKIFTISIITFSILNLTRIKLRFITLNVIALAVYKFFTFEGGIFTYRFHTNPDPYGYAAATGYFKNNFSLQQLSNDYLSITGFDKFSWESPTPLLNSPWAIPDQQLRYAAENTLLNSRSGFPLAISQFLKLFSDDIIFYKIWLILAIVLASLLFYLTKSLIVNELNYHTKEESNSFLVTLMGLAFVFQGWIILMALEGQTPQIWSLCIIVYIVVLTISIIKKKSDQIFKKGSLILLALVSTNLVYSQTLINIFLTLSIFIALLGVYASLKILKLQKIRLIWIIMTYLLLALAVFFPSTTGTSTIISQIVNSQVGGAIHIGINSFYDFFIPSPLSRVKIEEPIYGAGILEGSLIGALSIMIAMIIQLITLFFIYKKSLSVVFINLCAISSGVIGFLYLVGPYAGLNLIVIDYVWFRYQAQFIIFWIPALFLNMGLNKNLKISNFINPQGFFLKLSLLLIVIFSSFSVTKNYIKYSEIGSPQNCPQSIIMEKTYFYSDGNFWNTHSLAVCGPFKFVSDGQGSVFRNIPIGSSFAYLDPLNLEVVNVKSTLSKIDNLTAPCFRECVDKLVVK